MAKNNKKILTEDLFNSEGNTKVTPEILNESKTEEKEELDEQIIEAQEEFVVASTVLEHVEIPEVVEPISEKEFEEAFKNVKSEKESIKKPTFKTKNYGFNDESYYM